MGRFTPRVALFRNKVWEVHAAIPAPSLEVEERLGGAVEIQHSLQPIPRPLHRSDPLRLWTLVLGVALGQCCDVVDKHCIENAVFMHLLRTIAGVEVTSDAFIFEDDCPRHSG